MIRDAVRSWAVPLALCACLPNVPDARAGHGPWKAADPSYRLELPRDHGSHPDYRIEWWYYTGNVSTREGRRFGYQLTFFRVGMDPAPRNPSRWAVRDLFMTHLALTDVAGRRYEYAERLNRAGVGWAGAATDRYDVWNEEWRGTLDAHGRHLLSAQDGRVGIELMLEPVKPFVAQGEAGYSQKGSAPGNASHYYSLTRLSTKGRLFVAGEWFEVSGLSWMDHEFGSSFLEAGQLGWNWFSIQLDDGTDLMLYQFRRADGRIDDHSTGTFVLRDGATQRINAHEFQAIPGETWKSPASGARYPTEWHVQIPAQRMSLDVRAVLPDQELRTERSTGVTYWEGSIDVRGTRDGRPVTGRGYLELTGYTGAPMSDVLR